MEGAAARSISQRLLTDLGEDKTHIERLFCQVDRPDKALYENRRQFFEEQISRQEQRLKIIDSIYAAEDAHSDALKDQGKVRSTSSVSVLFVLFCWIIASPFEHCYFF